MICRYAQREGHETTRASDGLEAVELCRVNHFDIIIMDVMMPDMDGFTACKEIRKQKDIPILMLSARGTEYDKLFGFEVGIDDYVVKPFSPKELMARVNVIINQRRQRRKILYVSTTLEAVGATIGILRTQLIWITIAAILLAFGIAFLISRRFTKPVAALDRQARKMAESGKLDGIEKGFCSELDGLADTLYQTAVALNKAEQSRREFLANISHDLRTPLTMIRGYAEIIRDISWEDEAQRENDLAIIIRETNRLTELVNDILEPTALQSQTHTAQYEAVDLSAIARDAIRQFAPLCEQKRMYYQIKLRAGAIRIRRYRAAFAGTL